MSNRKSRLLSLVVVLALLIPSMAQAIPASPSNNTNSSPQLLTLSQQKDQVSISWTPIHIVSTSCSTWTSLTSGNFTTSSANGVFTIDGTKAQGTSWAEIAGYETSVQFDASKPINLEMVGTLSGMGTGWTMGIGLADAVHAVRMGPGYDGPTGRHAVGMEAHTGRYMYPIDIGGCGTEITIATNVALEQPHAYRIMYSERVEGSNTIASVTSTFDNGEPVTIDLPWRLIHPNAYFFASPRAIGDTVNALVTRLSVTNCTVPFFWQRDPNGINGHQLRSLPGPNYCGTNYDTIGKGGCTLTSATMLFRYYGASTTTNNTEMTPPNLSDCLDTNACPFNWITGAACSDGKASNPRRDYSFSYTRLDQEFNLNHRPVILQMCRPKGACNWEGPELHWVLVVGGQGTDPANYTIWDPWFECGQNMRLNSRSDTWDFVGMAVYNGTPTCSFSTEVPLCARSASPVGLPSGANATIVEQNTATPVDLTALSNVSGTAVLYRTTNITMTVHVTAQSSVGNITDMVIWSDTISNTIWQPFAPYVWLPLSDFVYAQFRDDMGNISAVVSDTPNPSAPPVAPDPDRVFLSIVTKR
jgi:hypothetical protein